MMRKDVRIGFAIGGVLLAVLIVYGLVTSGPNPRNNEVTLAPDDPGAVSNPNKNNNGTAPRAGPTPTNGAAPQTGEPSGESDPATSGTASRPGNGSGTNSTGANGALAANPAPTTAPADKWEHALKTGALPMMAKTETPSPTGAGAPPAPTDGGATPPPAQPANGSTDGSAGATNSSAGAINPSNDTSTPPANAPAANGNTAGTFNAAELANMASVPSANTTGSTGASTAAPASASGQRTHVVQPNETFASIAEVAYGSQHYYPHIVRANPNINPKKMRAGMTIVLPDRDQVVAKEPKPSDATALAGTGATHTAGLGTSPGASGAQQAAVVLPPIDERTQYRVQPAESLYKISLKLYGRADKVNAIYELNKDLIGPNRDRLKAGHILKLPEPPTNTTAAR